MIARREASALVLLVMAICAMLIAPVAHQLEHAREHERVRRDVASQPQHVHTDFEAVSAALDGAQHLSFFCPACSNAYRATPTSDSGVNRIIERGRAADDRCAPAVAPVIRSRAIRAPPVAG